MFSAIKKNRGFKITGAAILFFFAAGMIFPGSANLNTARAAVFGLPDYQEPVPLSNSYTLPILKGLKLDPANPLRIEFIIDTADNRQVGPNEASKLIRYFLAGLTIPEDDLWVNLSVYEQDRIVPPQLGETDLGKDLLSQDYILKQLMASVIYPESDTGKNYWAKTYQEVLKSFGTTSLPVDTFNKVWIIPDKAELSERKNFVFITQANLKAVMEEDLLALEKSVRSVEPVKPVVGLESSNRPNGLNRHNRLNKQNWPTAAKVNKIASQVMREIILPKVNIDVNQGRNFAMLRQIYHSLVLAAWFKKKLKESFYKNYIDKNKTAGIDLKEKGAKDKIYNLYVEAFKKGMYSIIKPETDPATKKRVRRRYFSGGVLLGGSSAISSAMKIDSTNRIMPNVIGRLVGVITNLLTSPSDEPTSSGNSPRLISRRTALGWGVTLAGAAVVTQLPGKALASTRPNPSEQLQKAIMAEVEALNFYSQESNFTQRPGDTENREAALFYQMVRDWWREASGESTLKKWKDKLDIARKHGTDPAPIAEIEEEIIRKLVAKISEKLGKSKNTWNLGTVASIKMANCLGRAQILYILGKTLGIPTSIIEATELSRPNDDIFDATHGDCMFTLSNGKTMITDTSRATDTISDPFEFNDIYVKIGNVLQKRPEAKLLIHREIRILEKNGITSALYNAKGLQGNNPREQIRCYAEAIRLDDGYANAHYNLGQLFYELGSPENAIAPLQKVIAINPRQVHAHNLLGLIALDSGKIRDAAKHFEDAAGIHPRFTSAYYNLGLAHYEAGKSLLSKNGQRAQDYFRKAEGYLNKAETLNQEKNEPRMKEKISSLRRLINNPRASSAVEHDPELLGRRKFIRDAAKTLAGLALLPGQVQNIFGNPPPQQVALTTTKPSLGLGRLHDAIKYEVGQLVFYRQRPGKPDDVESFFGMVHDWQTQGFSVLALRSALTEARRSRDPSAIVKKEEEIIKKLVDEIGKRLGKSAKTWDLGLMSSIKTTDCLGHAQILYILGKLMGLSVSMVEVLELPQPDDRILTTGHVECIFTLKNGKTIMTIYQETATVSEPFTLDDTYEKGDISRIIKNGANPLGLHREIRILTPDGISSLLFNTEGYDTDGKKEKEKRTRFAEAVRRDPNFAIAQYNLGNAQQSDERLRGEALTHLRKAVELNPRLVNAHYLLGVIYLQSGNAQDAIPRFEKFIAKYPNHLTTRYNLSLAYYKVGKSLKNDKERQEYFKKASKLLDNLQGRSDDEREKINGLLKRLNGSSNAGSETPPEPILTAIDDVSPDVGGIKLADINPTVSSDNISKEFFNFDIKDFDYLSFKIIKMKNIESLDRLSAPLN